MHLSAKFVLLLASISVSIASPIHDTALGKPAPLVTPISAPEHEIPNNYIVVFKKHVDGTSATGHHGWVTDLHETSLSSLRKRSQIPFIRGESDSSSTVDVDIDSLIGLKHTYNISGGLLGYSGAFDESVVEQIRNHPDVAYVEKDTKVYALEDPPVTEHSAPWGLARISHQESLNFGSYNKYVHQAHGGQGVDVYVIDTGTNIDHNDFEGRAHWGKTIPAGDEDVDGNGHGTHCSGTIAGKKYGVAKKANVYAVKVLRSNGSGTMSDVVKGVEYATESHLKRAAAAAAGKDKKFKGSAANMSLGGGKSTALDQAVDAAVMMGLNFAVAAGNDNADACDYSPAAAAKAVTVGASTLADERAYFSNYGKCVDIFAPGLNILSTWIGSSDATKTISGTSMASPHIAGLLAYFISLQPKHGSSYAVGELTPAQLKKNMISIASEDCLAGIPSDTPNLLAYNGGGSGNLSDIFDGTRYKPGHESSGRVVEAVTDVTEELIAETEAFLDDIEGKAVHDIKALFDKARAALNSRD